MSLVENIKDKLNSALPDLQTRYPIAKLGIFGSVTRTDFTDKSDIDIMVEFNGEIGWEFFDLEEELTKMLGVLKIETADEDVSMAGRIANAETAGEKAYRRIRSDIVFGRLLPEQ